jgi:hypothetical protein
MVKPSGSLQARIAIHLHFPTNSTKSLYDGEIADSTSPCTRMIMTAGFTPENSFWWDSHPWREESDFKPSKQYSKPVLASHKQWQTALRANLSAKIELVFGKPNQDAVFAEFRSLLEKLVLWDQHQTTLYLLFDPSKQYIQRILIFVNHPQFFFYNIMEKEAQIMDHTLDIACQLAGVYRTEKEKTYFQWRSQDRQQKNEDGAANGITLP